ncbi:MAG: lactate utilization protein [Pyrinomonadaceae bacterium]
MEQPRNNDEARREMFAAIRTQLAQSKPFDAAYEAHRAHRMPPEPIAHVSLDDPSLLVERFQRSLQAVGGHFLSVANESEAAEEIRRIVGNLSARRIAITNAPLVAGVLKLLTLDAELIEGATTAELFQCDLGITGAQWAIAETGTLVLESDQERHRLASLVPTVHVAIIEASRVRQTLGEVLRDLDERRADLSRAITFITGPSRTSDIELTLAIGVHGPAELYVIVLDGGAA